jgi:hypothetical protein
MTVIAFVLAGVSRDGIPGYIFPIAMVCDTALLIHFM